MTSATESFRWFGKFGKEEKESYEFATYLIITDNYNFIDDKEEAKEFKNKCQMQKEIYSYVSQVYMVDIDTYHTMVNRRSRHKE